MTPSTATPEEIEVYTQGACHIFAVALHQMFGWQIEIVRQDDEVWWQDEQDADNFIPAVVHAYAIDAFDNAWDIRGVRPASQIHHECQELFDVDETSGDTCRSEAEIKTYVGVLDLEGEQIDLPLGAYTDADTQRAKETAVRALHGLPGFGVSSSHAKTTHASQTPRHTDLAMRAMAMAQEMGIPHGQITQSVGRALAGLGIPVGCYFMPYAPTAKSSSRELLSVGGPWFDAMDSYESMGAAVEAVTKSGRSPRSGRGEYYNPLKSAFRGEQADQALDAHAHRLASALQQEQMAEQMPGATACVKAPRI